MDTGYAATVCDGKKHPWHRKQHRTPKASMYPVVDVLSGTLFQLWLP